MADARMTSLEESEKLRFKHILMAKMGLNAEAVTTAAVARHHQYGSMFFGINQLITNRKPMTIFIALLVALTGGTSMAAERALPGDALYAVKVNVNEEVRGWLTLDNEAKAHWEEILAERRLDEAAELAAEGKLDAESRAQLEANFQAHADRVANRIKKLADVDAHAAADIAANFEASLKAHDRILLNIGAVQDAKVESEVKSLLLKIRSRQNAAADAKVEAEADASAKADVRQSAEGRLNAAGNKIESVQKFIERKADDLGTEATAQANARLQVAVDLVAQGEAKLEAGANGEAFVLFGKAHAVAQEAMTLVQAKVRFENDDKSSPKPTTSPTATLSPSPSASVEASGQGSVNNNSTQGKVRIDLRF